MHTLSSISLTLAPPFSFLRSHAHMKELRIKPLTLQLVDDLLHILGHRAGGFDSELRVKGLKVLHVVQFIHNFWDQHLILKLCKIEWAASFRFYSHTKKNCIHIMMFLFFASMHLSVTIIIVLCVVRLCRQTSRWKPWGSTFRRSHWTMCANCRRSKRERSLSVWSQWVTVNRMHHMGLSFYLAPNWLNSELLSLCHSVQFLFSPAANCFKWTCQIHVKRFFF